MRKLDSLVVLAFALAACGDSTGPTTFTEGTWFSANVAGVYADVTLDLDAKTWEGRCGDCSPPFDQTREGGPVELASGVVTLKGSPCRWDIRLEGGVSGGTFSGTATPVTTCSPVGRSLAGAPVTFSSR